MMKRKIVSIFALMLSITILFCSCVRVEGDSQNILDSENLQDISQELPKDETEPITKEDFVINKSTLKFHSPTCYYIEMMLEENKLFVSSTHEALVDEGYSPCIICQ